MTTANTRDGLSDVSIRNGSGPRGGNISSIINHYGGAQRPRLHGLANHARRSAKPRSGISSNQRKIFSQQRTSEHGWNLYGIPEVAQDGQIRKLNHELASNGNGVSSSGLSACSRRILMPIPNTTEGFKRRENIKIHK